MVTKLKNKIIRSPYFWTGILLFILLTFFAYHKERQVENETKKKMEMMVQNVCISNIATFKNILTHYIEQLEYIKHAAFFSEESVRQNIAYFSQKDSLMRHIEIVENSGALTSCLMQPFFTDNESYIQIMLPIESPRLKNKALLLKIKLMDLHTQIAENKNFAYAYLTLIYDNRYVFHPDETKIGLPVEPNNRFITGQDKENTVTETFSDYLNMDIYRYFQFTEMGGTMWTFTANVPGISFNELVSSIRNAFIYLSMLASAAFAVIFLFGIWYWKKEFLKRQQIQQEKINLELKNELQKQQSLATELEQLKSGLNPHFLFNSLSSLKILVSKQPEEAKNFAVALSNLYRYLLKQEKCDLITLEEELNFTKDYIYLQQIRFAQRIQTEIAIEEMALQRKLPPMSLQLLVENCIKHTKMSNKEPLKIKIYTDSNNLVVENNYNPLESVVSSGIGLENLIKRYSFLTLQACSFQLEENKFVAKIPLL